jgi:hypothetical protein
MTPEKTKTKTNVDDVPLEIDEDIELDESVNIPSKSNKLAQQRELPETQVRMRTGKPIIAGIFLLMAFFLNLLLPITFIMLIYDAEIATGETTLSGVVRDEDELPIEGVTVTVVDTNLTTRTDAKGKFRFNDIPVGMQEVRFTKNGYREYIVRKTMFTKDLLNRLNEDDNIIKIPGNLQNGVYLGPFEGPFISSEVMADNLNLTIFGKVSNVSGVPLNNLEVKVLNTNITTNSGSNGEYILTNVPPGIVSIQLMAEVNSNKTIRTILFARNRSLELNLTYNELNDQTIDEISGVAGSISGVVKNKDGTPVGSALVTLDISPERYTENSTLTQANGVFEFQDVPVGIYDAEITNLDYEIYEITNITISTNETITIPEITFETLEKPITEEDDISGAYSCTMALIIFAIITLIGAISAFQRKRYGIAFFGAILGIAPTIIIFRLDICVASIFGLLGLVMLVFSREEFEFK